MPTKIFYKKENNRGATLRRSDERRKRSFLGYFLDFMTRSRYNSIVTIAFALTLFFGGALSVSAQALGVMFENEPNPLFQGADVLPGDSVSRTVTVTNNGSESESVYVDVRNTFSDGLADVMQISVVGGTTYYDDVFANFFTDTPVALGTLAPGSSEVYIFTASLDKSVGNTYQSTTMGFDICVGFEGGSVTCDGGGSTTNGGGGGGGRTAFRLFNETVDKVNVTAGGATLGWNTNRDGTTYLVCGNVANGPFTLNPDAEFFGYEFDISEVDNDTQVHTITLTDLDPGTYECVPASRRSTSNDYTTGDALTFTLPAGDVGGETISVIPTLFSDDGSFVPRGSVFGAATTAEPEPDEPESATTTDEETPASTFGEVERSVPEEPLSGNPFCLLWVLLLIAGISLVWSVLDDRVLPAHTQFRPLFARNLIFLGVYVLGVLFTHFIGYLEALWLIFIVTWVIATAIDYHAHHTASDEWGARNRNIFYIVAALALVGSALIFGFPCMWWPFAAIAAGSLILLLAKI